MDTKLRGRLVRFVLLVSVFAMLGLSVASAQDDASSVMTKNADGQTITAWGWDTPEFNKPILAGLCTS